MSIFESVIEVVVSLMHGVDQTIPLRTTGQQDKMLRQGIGRLRVNQLVQNGYP